MYILFDIGGTKTRVACSQKGTGIDAVSKFDTPKDFEAGVARIIEEIHTLAGGAAVDIIAGGIRGPLAPDRSGIVSDSVLTDWVQKPLRERLMACAPVVILENDAAVAALGEATYGAGKGHAIVAYHTVSTGVGGARVVAGRIDAARVGFEIGKQTLDIDHTLVPQSADGTLEGLVSGTSIERRFNKKPYEIPQADPLWQELARYLAHGLRNTIAYWSPDVIVLGGSMVLGDPRIFRQDIALETAKLLKGEMPCPPILDAALGDSAGLYGALALAVEAEKNH